MKGKKLILHKMLMVEIVGETLYQALAHKSLDANMKSIHNRLALNERETASRIRKEIARSQGKTNVLGEKILFELSHFIFGLFTVNQLLGFLKSVLKRRIYRQWFYQYTSGNQTFWDALLAHENLQHELLGYVLTAWKMEDMV